MTRVLVIMLQAFFGTAVLAADAPVCVPKPLPPQEERTDAFWKSYLNEALHRCYDTLVSEAALAGVYLTEGPMAGCLCPIGICTITVGRTMLQSVNSPEEAIFIVGHEVGHMAIAFHPKDYRGSTSIEIERIADRFAVTPIPEGSCYAVNVLLWMRSRIPDVEMFSEGRMELEMRIATLLAQCEKK